MLPFLYVSLFHTLIILNCLGAWCRSNVFVGSISPIPFLHSLVSSLPSLYCALPSLILSVPSVPFPFPFLVFYSPPVHLDSG